MEDKKLQGMAEAFLARLGAPKWAPKPALVTPACGELREEAKQLLQQEFKFTEAHAALIYTKLNLHSLFEMIRPMYYIIAFIFIFPSEANVMNTRNLHQKTVRVNVQTYDVPIAPHQISPHHNTTTQPHQHITTTTTALLFFVAGAVFGDVAVSLVVSGAAFGEILKDCHSMW